MPPIPHMKAIVLTRSWSDRPEQASHGIFQRLSLFLDALDAEFSEIQVLAFAPRGDDMDGLAERHRVQYQRGRQARVSVTAVARTPNPSDWSFWSRYGAGALSVDAQESFRMLDRPDVAATVKSHVEGAALVFAHRLPVFTPLLRAWPGLAGAGRAADAASAGLPPVVFDMDDVEHQSLARTLWHSPAWPSERLRLLHLPALMRRERLALRASACSFTCSEADAASLRRLSGGARVEAIPNSVHGPAERLPVQGGRQVVGFIGSFVHPPNRDAALWLMREIWPRLHARRPGAQLVIAGAGARDALGGDAPAAGVTVLDFVERIEDFYGRIDVMLAPLRFGAGTRVKIVESAAYGVPVVSTRLGAEGLSFAPDHAIALADAADGLVDRTLALLDDPRAREAQAVAAREHFQRHYERASIVARLGALMRTARGG